MALCYFAEFELSSSSMAKQAGLLCTGKASARARNRKRQLRYRSWLLLPINTKYKNTGKKQKAGPFFFFFFWFLF
jgi:hypothetical protein